MIEITKARTITFMESRNFLVVQGRKMKKTEDGLNLFSKAWKIVHGLAKLFMDDLLSDGLLEKVMICYWK